MGPTEFKIWSVLMWLENTIAIWVVLTSLTASWTSTRLCCKVNDDTCATSENDWKNKSSRLASANFRLEVAITFCQMGIKLSLSYKWSLKSDIQAKSTKDLLSVYLEKQSVKTRLDPDRKGLIKKSGASFRIVADLPTMYVRNVE